MILQLDPALPLDTPKGPAWAHFVIDYGQEHELLWVCFLKETGECWAVNNRDVRLEKNWSLGVRPQTSTEQPLPVAVSA